MSPRAASKGRRGFIWIPPKPARWDVKINAVSVKTDIFSAEFTRGICPEIGDFEIVLFNSDKKYTDKYSADDTVGLYLDTTDGTTLKFEGKIDSLSDSFGGGFGIGLQVSGAHITKALNGIKVIRSYSGDKTCDEIFKDLVSTYLTGYNTDNISISTNRPVINWEKKSFWACVLDLCKRAKSGSRFDSYLDDDKSFYFFERESIDNTTDAIVLGQTMIGIGGITTQTITQKDKVTVIGDAGGLPIIATAGTGDKEDVISDSSINTVSEASDIAQNELNLKSPEKKEGEEEAFLLTSIKPGQRIRYSNPLFRVNTHILIYKYTHSVPIERTTVTLGEERSQLQLWREQKDTNLALEDIKNPFNMTDSFNLTFDDDTNIETKDSNIAISEGKIKLSSGTEGTFETTAFKVPAGISEVHLQLVADNLSALIKLSTDNGGKYETLVIEGKTELIYPVSSNALVILRVKIQSATCEIDSLGLLYKA